MTVPSHDHSHSHQVHHPHPHPMTREQSREHDVHGLRLALGSILSPKRVSTPSSRNSSGTASPCPAHFGPGLVHSYHHGPSHLHTPFETHDEPDILNQSAPVQEICGMNAHVVSPSIPPPAVQRPSSPTRDRSDNTPPPILTTSNVHSLSPQQEHSVKDSQDTQHSPTVRAVKQVVKDRRERDGKENFEHQRGLNAYIATLQSGRAWDALVHGNMS